MGGLPATNPGNRWTEADAQIIARSLVDRIRRKLVTFSATLESTDPTYPDTRVSVEEAQRVVAEIVGRFF